MSALNLQRQSAQGRVRVVVALLLAVSLAGCGKSRVEEGQVVTRVNSDDISVHQLNFAIAQAPGKITSISERDLLLEKMIDRQLAVQQSLAQGLDRRPEVMVRLEEARRDILAAAYADEISAKTEAPAEDAAAKYYAAHPGLFAKRKIYRLREVSIPAESAAAAEALARLERKQRITDIIAWLRQQPGRFSDQLALRPAEQLPIEVVDRLSRLSPGDTIAFRLPRALVIYEVLSAEAAPLNWKAAVPIIRAHLAKQQGSAALGEELKRLRAAAKIIRMAPAGQMTPAG